MITLTPAYGIDYKSKRLVTRALEAGEDFIINELGHQYDGKPCHARDLDGASVKVRYNNLRNVFVYKTPGKDISHTDFGMLRRMMDNMSDSQSAYREQIKDDSKTIELLQESIQQQQEAVAALQKDIDTVIDMENQQVEVDYFKLSDINVRNYLKEDIS